MAKRRTGKRSVKRAFKKRRTIRKFRKTMRRYLQSGGINPAITMIAGLALAFVLEKSPKLMALLALLGMAEMPNYEMTGGASFFDSLPTNAFGVNPASVVTSARNIANNPASVVTAARNIANNPASVKQAATVFASKAQTKTIAVSKDTVINSLNKLKDAFEDDKNAGQITKCVEQLVAKINQAPAPASASAPENVALEDITTSVQNADDTTPAPQGEQFVDMVKRVLALKIDLLKTKYETAINDRIQSFQTKYDLGNDDMKCIHVLKDAVLADLINKKNSLIDEIMKNERVKIAIEKAKKGSEFLSAGADMIKGKLGTVLQQNTQAAAGAAALDKFKGSLGWRK
jgi:hypothetical protein